MSVPNIERPSRRGLGNEGSTDREINSGKNRSKDRGPTAVSKTEKGDHEKSGGGERQSLLGRERT